MPPAPGRTTERRHQRFRPDNVPVFDWIAPNVFMVADSNHGFKMSGVGSLTARRLMGERVPELLPLAFSRHGNGQTFGSSDSPLSLGLTRSTR